MDAHTPGPGPTPLLITGANGHLGRRLLAHLHGRLPVRAVVRSSSARAAVLRATTDVDVRVVDFADVAALTEAARGCTCIVHLVGILRETRTSRYADADQAPMAALIKAATAAGVGRIVYLSIAGADARSRNRCLASRGRCEQMLLDAVTPAFVLRVPMVLGDGDYAAAALARHARARLCLQFRAGSREQPIDANDVVAALMAATTLPMTGSRRLTLAGPESLPRHELIARARRVLGTSGRVVSLPLACGMWLARACEWLFANPPLTTAMLGVLDHDDDVDSAVAAHELAIRLTPLDVTLARVLRDQSGGSAEQ